MEEKFRTIHIADVISKQIMVEMSDHLVKANSSTKRKWFAQIISKDTYENRKKEIEVFNDLILYLSEYEIIYTLAYGYLKTMDITIEECYESECWLKGKDIVLCLYSTPF